MNEKILKEINTERKLILILRMDLQEWPPFHSLTPHVEFISISLFLCQVSLGQHH